jgi:hypothetical protein
VATTPARSSKFSVAQPTRRLVASSGLRSVLSEEMLVQSCHYGKTRPEETPGDMSAHIRVTPMGVTHLLKRIA